MRKQTLLFALPTTLSLALAPSQAADIGHDVQILGFHLGMTPDDVAQNTAVSMNGAEIMPVVRFLTYNSYRTPDMTFGAEIKEGVNSNTVLNHENVRLNYSTGDHPKVIYITRNKIFDAASAPTVASVIAAAKSKYGAPAEEDNRGSSHRLTWTFGASTRHTQTYSADNTLFENCSGWVGNAGNPFNRMINGDVNFGANDLQLYPRCGVVMNLSLNSMPNDPSLVQRIESDIGDFKDLVASYNDIWSQLKNGFAQKSGQDQQSAPAPRL